METFDLGAYRSGSIRNIMTKAYKNVLSNPREAAKIPACLSGILCEKGLNVDDFVQMAPTLDRVIEQMAK